MEKTWRWFGPGDAITLSDIRQTGAQGVVTALHHLPNGEPWPDEQIRARADEISSAGLRWSVVESLPVHEQIKYAGPDRDTLIEAYIQSLHALGRVGIRTVCYNFMPVIDWIRTDLNYRLPDGAHSLYFELARYVAFELYVLGRQEAAGEYPEPVVARAREIGQNMSPADKAALIDVIIVKTQGFVDGISATNPDQAVALFQERLAPYRGMHKEDLFEHLRVFLNRVAPEAERAGVRLAIHPDDPPMPVLGLPRIVSTAEDIIRILACEPSPANGYTLCTGSLGAHGSNDLAALLRATADRVHFVHLRNIERLENGDFFESGHLKGRVDMFDVVQGLLSEQRRRHATGRQDAVLPMRVDHGLVLPGDEGRASHPGYPLVGRLRGLAEISGLEMGIERALFNKERAG